MEITAEEVASIADASREVNYRKDYSYLQVCCNLKSGKTIFKKMQSRNHKKLIEERGALLFLFNIDEAISEGRVFQILKKLDYAISHPISY